MYLKFAARVGIRVTVKRKFSDDVLIYKISKKKKK